MVLDKVKSLGNGEGTKYEFYSGKGGVGKTTLSAARAVYLSEQGNRVLIISTDPAHSLSDSFEMDIGPEETEIKENLYGVEISPDRAVEEFRDKISGEDMMEGMGLGGMNGMLEDIEEGDDTDMASMTPGIDEMAAFDKFIEYMHRDDYDYVLFDTAPTGHTLRFLSLPDVMESWVGKLVKIKTKISNITGTFKSFMPFSEEEDEEEEDKAEVLENLKERIEDAREILSDEDRTRFWLVMLPQEMSLYETKRTVKQLEDYGINTNDLIVNQILPEGNDCDYCREKRERQMNVVESTENEIPGVKIHKLESFKEEVKGLDLLERVGKKVYM